MPDKLSNTFASTYRNKNLFHFLPTEEDYILPLNNSSLFTVTFGVGSDDGSSVSCEGSGYGNVQTVMISTVDDCVVEGDHYFTVSINSTSPPAMIGTCSSMVAKIMDDDCKSTLKCE